MWHQCCNSCRGGPCKEWVTLHNCDSFSRVIPTRTAQPHKGQAPMHCAYSLSQSAACNLKHPRPTSANVCPHAERSPQAGLISNDRRISKSAEYQQEQVTERMQLRAQACAAQAGAAGRAWSVLSRIMSSTFPPTSSSSTHHCEQGGNNQLQLRVQACAGEAGAAGRAVLHRPHLH